MIEETAGSRLYRVASKEISRLSSLAKDNNSVEAESGSDIAAKLEAWGYLDYILSNIDCEDRLAIKEELTWLTIGHSSVKVVKEIGQILKIVDNEFAKDLKQV